MSQSLEKYTTKLFSIISFYSTHSFLNEATAEDLKCRMTATTPLSVTIANGSKMYSNYKCAEFKWQMQGHEFTADLRILELGGSDIVLGVDWMRTVSPLIFDFNKLEVTVEIDGRKLTLVGSLENGECKMITGRKLQKLIQKKGGQISQLYSIQTVELEKEDDVKEEHTLAANSAVLPTPYWGIIF